jgi:hypothetical protein
LKRRVEVDAAQRVRGLNSAIALLDGGQYVQA